MNTKYNYRGERFLYYSKKELRKAFFEYCNEIGEDTTGHKTRFSLNLNILFNDWIDFLRKDGLISEKLRTTSTLY